MGLLSKFRVWRRKGLESIGGVRVIVYLPPKAVWAYRMLVKTGAEAEPGSVRDLIRRSVNLGTPIYLDQDGGAFIVAESLKDKVREKWRLTPGTL
jgi:hypothetical protein